MAVPTGTYCASKPASTLERTMMSLRILFTAWPMWISPLAYGGPSCSTNADDLWCAPESSGTARSFANHEEIANSRLGKSPRIGNAVSARLSVARASFGLIVLWSVLGLFGHGLTKQAEIQKRIALETDHRGSGGSALRNWQRSFAQLAKAYIKMGAIQIARKIKGALQSKGRIATQRWRYPRLAIPG